MRCEEDTEHRRDRGDGAVGTPLVALVKFYDRRGARYFRARNDTERTPQSGFSEPLADRTRQPILACLPQVGISYFCRVYTSAYPIEEITGMRLRRQ